ncbi:uncharacterized protein [Dermacentor albipictus]|uniref:uncharacterized protein isoform X2 n=1 Tax=Dermacentor albipictus TaxID=60249 RepID=UPI0038FD0448
MKRASLESSTHRTLTRSRSGKGRSAQTEQDHPGRSERADRLRRSRTTPHRRPRGQPGRAHHHAPSHGAAVGSDALYNDHHRQTKIRCGASWARRRVHSVTGPPRIRTQHHAIQTVQTLQAVQTVQALRKRTSGEAVSTADGACHQSPSAPSSHAFSRFVAPHLVFEQDMINIMFKSNVGTQENSTKRELSRPNMAILINLFVNVLAAILMTRLFCRMLLFWLHVLGFDPEGIREGSVASALRDLAGGAPSVPHFTSSCSLGCLAFRFNYKLSWLFFSRSCFL